MCVQNTLDAAVALLHAFPEAVLKPDAAHRLPLQAPPKLNTHTTFPAAHRSSHKNSPWVTKDTLFGRHPRMHLRLAVSLELSFGFCRTADAA